MKNSTIKDIKKINEIINRSDICHIGMIDLEGLPYVLPFNFGFKNNTIYIHTSREGKKADIFDKKPYVCLTFSTDYELFHRHEHVACSYGWRYRSVIGYGKIIPIEDFEDKKEVMNIIMKKYTDKEFDYNPPSINNVAIFKIELDKIEGRESGY